jgi:hypothetical protein
MGEQRTVERLHVLRRLARLRVAVGAAVDWSQSQPIPSKATKYPPNLLPSLFHRFSSPNGRVPSLRRRRKKDRALTSPHAVGEAAGGHDGARCDGAPGDSRNSATGEHFGGKVEKWRVVYERFGW